MRDSSNRHQNSRIMALCSEKALWFSQKKSAFQYSSNSVQDAQTDVQSSTTITSEQVSIVPTCPVAETSPATEACPAILNASRSDVSHSSAQSQSQGGLPQPVSGASTSD